VEDKTRAPGIAARRLSVGAIELESLSDGAAHYPAESLATNVRSQDVRASLGGRIDDHGMFLAPYRPLLIRADGKLILVDSGLGELAQTLGEPAGRLRQSLHAAGVTADDIQIVLLTHCHPDHIGGLTEIRNGVRVPVFGAARHYVWQAEWEFWTSEASLSRLPDILAAPARVQLPPLRAAGLIEPVGTETEVAGGVHYLPAPGHTPGHAVVSIRSAGESAIYAGDAVLDPVNFEHPDWYTLFDAIPEATVKTRRRLLEMAARERSVFTGFHLGVGRVSRRGSAFHFEPLS
jgi:glyoxylase-like metal-dependent hydrolase (beta-lactamase superfamily II)